MAKTYPLKALWPLLPFEVAPAPLQATLDAYGGGLVKYAVNQDGIWLYSLADPLTASESENLTGYYPADLVPKQIDGVEGYFYALLGGAPLLPIPFTKDQLIAFNERTAGLIAECIERGSETDAWIADLEKENPDAVELARGIRSGKWPMKLADLVNAKIDDASKPHFRLADGIEPTASAMAVKSALDYVQRQQDMLKSMGITPDLLKQIEYQKEMEKLLGNTVGNIAETVYQQELERNQDMLRRAIGPSASEIAAETLGRQFASTLGLNTVGSAYLQTQSTVRADIEKALGGSIGSVADSLAQLDRAGLDAALGRYRQPTASEMFEQMEQERIQKANEDEERRLNTIEVPRLHFYDQRAEEDRRLERERQHKLETARLEEIARHEVREELAARKQAPPPILANTAGTPVASDGLGNKRVEPSWTLTMPKRFPGYSKPLYDHLKSAHAAGKPCPTARNVLDDWKRNKPINVAEVSDDGLKYYDANGNTKPADLAAIRKAIERMTT